VSYTYADVLRRLIQEREIDLLELLEISSEDLVERFRDKIEEKLEDFIEEFEEEEEENDWENYD
jgi:hypothetical protein